jgi:hypothetical protein
MSHETSFTSGPLTVLFDGTHWVGIFERTNEQGYSVAKFIFGEEPMDEDVYQFVLHGLGEVRFTTPVPADAGMAEAKHMSFKHRQREIERILAEANTTQKADGAKAALRAEQEAQRQARERAAKAEREAEQERKYQLRQEKRKEKRRGH